MPATASPPLKIAIVGAGQIGSAVAFQLVRVGGHAVSVVARPGSPRLRQLQRDGAIVDVTGTRAPVSVSAALDETAPYDLVIVTLLAHQTDAVLPSLERSAAARILFMGNTFTPERLRAAVGEARCVLGLPFLQATLDAEGRLKATIGAGGQKSLVSDARSAALFNAAGLPAALEADMPLWLRCHVPLCVAFESVSVLAMRRGGGASWREAMTLARGVRACFGLIGGLGYATYPAIKRRIAVAPTAVVAGILWSISRIRSFRELLASGEAECRALIETMVEAAPGAKTPVDLPAIQAMKP